MVLLLHVAVVTVDPHLGAADPYVEICTQHLCEMELGAELVFIGRSAAVMYTC